VGVVRGHLPLNPDTRTVLENSGFFHPLLAKVCWFEYGMAQLQSWYKGRQFQQFFMSLPRMWV
jgi:hypothetical protein